MCYRLLIGLTQTDYKFALSRSSISQTRENSLKLNKKHLASTRDAALLHNRIINQWNPLPDTLWLQGVFLASNVTYLNMQTTLEMTFLLLVTISLVWYVFLVLSICFFVSGRAPVSKELDLPLCFVLYYTYCRNYFMLDSLIDK